MSIKISVTRLICNKTTIEASPDEVFCVMFIAEGSPGTNGSRGRLARRISEAREGVGKGDSWDPGLSATVEVADNTKALAVVLALYEKDNGETYEALKDSDTPLGAQFDLKSVQFPDNPGSWTSWVKGLLKLILAFISSLKADDLIGRADFGVEPGKPDHFRSRDFTLNGHGGRYTVTVKVERA